MAEYRSLYCVLLSLPPLARKKEVRSVSPPPRPRVGGIYTYIDSLTLGSPFIHTLDYYTFLRKMHLPESKFLILVNNDHVGVTKNEGVILHLLV
jgi:hypothetical protein